MPNISFDNIPITDWINSIGVAIAFPAAVYSIIALFKKDRTHEEKLNKLEELVATQKAINESLSSQVVTTKQTLELELRKYTDQTKTKYEELKEYLIELLKGLEEPIKNQVDKLKEAATKYKAKKHNGFDYEIDTSLRVDNLNNINNNDLYKIFVSDNKNERSEKISSFLKLERSISFLAYMQKEIRNEITTIHAQYQKFESQWGNNMQQIQGQIELFISSNVANHIPPEKDSFVSALDSAFANWNKMEEKVKNIKELYFLHDNYLEPIRIVCNKYISDPRIHSLLPRIVNSEDAFINIDYLRGMLGNNLMNYADNLERAGKNINIAIQQLEN